MIEGTYAVQNKLPAIGGTEGVGRVEKVILGLCYLILEVYQIGSKVTNVSVGDHVLSSFTWTEFGIVDADELYKIRKEIDLVCLCLNNINFIIRLVRHNC
jgi:NADPH:quinone reductase-like Zn-dependent oxidoreductase